MMNLKFLSLSVFVGLSAVAIGVFPRMSSATSEPSGDPVQGKALFEKRCTGCHSLDRDKEGPRLGNVYGRHAGTVGSFAYSDALKSAHVTWDANSLDKWLTDPDSVIPDNDMSFRVSKPEERRDIIEFLRRNAGN